MNVKFLELLSKKGLYDKVEIGLQDYKDLVDLLLGDFVIDLYCNECQKAEQTFKPIRTNSNKIIKDENIVVFPNENVGHKTVQLKTNYEYLISNNTNFTLTLICAKSPQHKIVFMFDLRINYIMKIGQYPSVADLALPEKKDYKKELSEYGKEYTSAIGLNAHGVGIGSFVYLRRILETLVLNAFKEAEEDGTIDLETFNKTKKDGKEYNNSFTEKIKLLKNYLPEILVNNVGSYGILSSGIHEWSDDECKHNFNILQGFIELILDETIERKRKKEKTKLLENEMQKLVNKNKE